MIRAGKAVHQVFDLLRQGRWRVDNGDDLFFRLFIDNEFVFHSFKSLLIVHLPQEAQHGDDSEGGSV